MSCQDQKTAYDEAQQALAGAVLERTQARDDKVAADNALAEAQAAADAAAQRVTDTETAVNDKGAAADAAHRAWIDCVVNS